MGATGRTWRTAHFLPDVGGEIEGPEVIERAGAKAAGAAAEEVHDAAGFINGCVLETALEGATASRIQVLPRI